MRNDINQRDPQINSIKAQPYANEAKQLCFCFFVFLKKYVSQSLKANDQSTRSKKFAARKDKSKCQFKLRFD